MGTPVGVNSTSSVSTHSAKHTTLFDTHSRLERSRTSKLYIACFYLVFVDDAQPLYWMNWYTTDSNCRLLNMQNRIELFICHLLWDTLPGSNIEVTAAEGCDFSLSLLRSSKPCWMLSTQRTKFFNVPIRLRKLSFSKAEARVFFGKLYCIRDVHFLVSELLKNEWQWCNRNKKFGDGYTLGNEGEGDHDEWGRVISERPVRKMQCMFEYCHALQLILRCFMNGKGLTRNRDILWCEDVEATVKYYTLCFLAKRIVRTNWEDKRDALLRKKLKDETPRVWASRVRILWAHRTTDDYSYTAKQIGSILLYE